MNMGEAKCSAGDSLLCLILSRKTAAVLARFTPAFMIFFVLSLGMVANAAQPLCPEQFHFSSPLT